MVTFKLVNQTESFAIYHYYPEGNENIECGVIRLNIPSKTAVLEKLAEKDFERIITKDELNQSRESINEMREEIGQPPLTEEELPVATHDIVSRFYADPAISAIQDACQSGEIPKSGKQMWY